MHITDQNMPAGARPAGRERRERVEALLARHPALTDSETHDVLTFLRKGPPLDIGLLTSNDAIRPQLDRFRANHARDLSLGAREIAILGVIMLAFLAAVALLWNAGAG